MYNQALKKQQNIVDTEFSKEKKNKKQKLCNKFNT
jgi:hypothetical protein